MIYKFISINTSLLEIHCLRKARTEDGVLVSRSCRDLCLLYQPVRVLALFGVGALGPVQCPLPYKLSHLNTVNTGHEEPAAPGHQGQRPVLGETGVGGDHVLPDAAGDEAAELLDGPLPYK